MVYGITNKSENINCISDFDERPHGHAERKNGRGIDGYSGQVDGEREKMCFYLFLVVLFSCPFIHGQRGKGEGTL